jgi:hypothetical protein
MSQLITDQPNAHQNISNKKMEHEQQEKGDTNSKLRNS